MDLTVRQAAEHLGVSESQAQRWISDRGLPAHQANERLVLNAVELWEWAVSQGITVSRSLLEHARGDANDAWSLAEGLRGGGVFSDIAATEKRGVLREFVERFPFPPEHDRARLLGVLEAREAQSFTAIGDGVAIPRTRDPIILDIDHPFLTLCLLRQPVDFHAADGAPVHAVFMVVSPTVTEHFRVLAQLALVLRDDVLRGLLRQRAAARDIIDRIELLQKTRTTAMFRAMESES
jgi:PTS system nitrogen regulatory IIA component